jgi:hypothetical protein
MAITYTRDETFTGKRKLIMPDLDNEGETKEEELDVIDIIVTFRDSSYAPHKTHTRTVNVCYDSSGNYDEDATKERIEQVMLGVQNKFALGAIQ